MLDCGGLEKNYPANATSTKVRKSMLSAKTSDLKSSLASWLAMLLLPYGAKQPSTMLN